MYKRIFDIEEIRNELSGFHQKNVSSVQDLERQGYLRGRNRRNPIKQKKLHKTKEGLGIDLTPPFLLFQLLLALGELPVLYRRLADDFLELVCEVFRGTVA